MANSLINGGGGVSAPATSAQTDDRRVWKYRPGEAKLFDNPESVPDGEGWGDVPVEATAEPTVAMEEPAPAEPPKRRGRPPKVEEPADEPEGE